MRRIPLSVVVLLATASAAHASTVSNLGGVVTVVPTDTGETNALTLSYAAGSGTTLDGYTVHDANVPVTIGGGCTSCTQVDANTVVVPGNAGTDVTLGDGGSSVAVNGQDTSAGGTNAITGGAGADTIHGGLNDSVVNGGEGNDTITGQAGDDVLTGGNGNDTLSGGGGDDSFGTASGDGADAIAGGPGLDDINYFGRGAAISVTEDGQANDGESGEGDNLSGLERVVGTAFADTISLTGTTSGGQIIGNAGNDTLSGSAGGETIDGSNGNDAINGGAGGDTLNGNAGNDSITGGAGDDTINPGDGDDAVNGGAGNDQIAPNGLLSGDGADTFIGGPGEDSISYANHDGPVNISEDGQANDGEAGEGDNVGADVEDVAGTTEGDTITGSAADNQIQGNGGPDVLSGGAGNDQIQGGFSVASAAGVTLNGGDGVDTLIGNSGDDVFNGGNGNDKFLTIGGGADVFNGGDGVDTVSFAFTFFASGVSITPDGVANDGRDGEGANVMPDVEDFVGSSGPDTITGAPGVKNRIDGAGGGDTINVANNPADADNVVCRAAGGGLGLARAVIFNGENNYEDVVNADGLDKVSASGNTACATINRTGGPQVKVAVAKVKPTGSAYAVPIDCVVAHPRCNVTAQAATPKGTGLGSTRFTIASGKTGQALFHLSSTQSHALKKGKTVKVRITVNAADSTGTATAQRTVTLHH